MSRQLSAAEKTLSASRLLLEHDHVREAASRAYYAMFYAAHAALNWSGVDIPRTHNGTITVFERECIHTGAVSPRMIQLLRDANRLRRSSDYELFVSVNEDAVASVVEGARDFLEEIRRLTDIHE